MARNMCRSWIVWRNSTTRIGSTSKCITRSKAKRPRKLRKRKNCGKSSGLIDAMKKFYLFLAAISIFLIGCGNKIDTEKHAVTTQQSVQNENDGDLNDLDLYSRAISNKDASDCEKIQDNALEQKCADLVQQILRAEKQQKSQTIQKASEEER